MRHAQFRNTKSEIFEKSRKQENFTKMNSGKKTYGEVLKNHSAALNPQLTATAVVPKAVRVRLTEDAKKNLRNAINDKPMVLSAKPTNPVVASEKRVKSLMELTRPVVLASASAGILPGFMLDDRYVMQSSVNSASVSLLKSEELGAVVREGHKENPIDVDDDDDSSENEFVWSEDVKPKTENAVDHYSVDGVDVPVNVGDFDANDFMSEVIDESTNTPAEEPRQASLELDRTFRLDPTRPLKKAKLRMEDAFINDYAAKMKAFKRDDREDYEGEYTFIVKVCVVDNVVDVKETVTYGKVVCIAEEKDKPDEEYKPESDFESSDDIDEKRRKSNMQALIFDPEKQVTRYNTTPLPGSKEGHPMNETVSETASYHWLSHYEIIPSDSKFNTFLNKFKPGGEFLTRRKCWFADFQGVRYKFLRVGTNSKQKVIKVYNQFVIGNDFKIYRLGANGSPNVDLGVNPRSRAKHLPPPINKSYSIASLFWANGLLRSQGGPWMNHP